MNNQLKKFKNQVKEIKKEAKERTIGYISAALSLVAGLAWNEAIKGLIEYLFPLSKDTLLVKFIYAVLATLIVVVITIYLVRLFKKDEKES